MANQPAVIDVVDVEKVFTARDGVPITALQDCNMRVGAGEFVCIVGPSGCGKTTLLRIIAGLIEYTAGSVKVQGKPVEELGREIAMVFQKPVLLPWRTTLDNVLLPIDFHGKVSEEVRQKARELLQLVALQGFEGKYPYELSGGMQQRVAISRALISDPNILLMDEPFGALDAMTRDSMNLELLRIWSETQRSTVFITHSIPEAIFLANRVVVMSSGPGRVLESIDIDLPRPRERKHRYSETFGQYEARISSLIGVTAAIS